MGNFTPGPWRWLNSWTLIGDHGRRPVVLNAASRNRTPYIATRADDGTLEPLAINHPNAHLIAAAPEMLEALKLVSEFGCDCHDEPERSPCMVCVANEAIAKAEGKN